MSSSPILGCGESSTLPSPLLHEEPRDGRRTMWSGLKNALEMFHSFSMARPWSEGPLAAGRSDCVQAAEPNEDPSSATEAALVIAPASPLLSTPIHAHRVRRYDRRATFVAPAPPPRHQLRPLEFLNSKRQLTTLSRSRVSARTASSAHRPDFRTPRMERGKKVRPPPLSPRPSTAARRARCSKARARAVSRRRRASRASTRASRW